MSTDEYDGTQSSDIQQILVCSDCGCELPPEWIRQTNLPPCPDCGSEKRVLNVVVRENLCVRDSLRAKLRNDALPSKKKTRIELFTGAELRKSDGKWMDKVRLINKIDDRYLEHVVDPETGAVVHHTEESVREHQGHGSAKFKKTESDGSTDPKE